MLTYLIAMGIILLVLLGWVAVQHLARAFAAKHPEFPVRDEGGGCGRQCSCIGNHCARDEDEETSVNAK
ncbi:MAG: chemotaxis protein [Gammaproteobacteria bacterium]|nr:chemotaxis protein [Gammaproteobacteria bacterium]